MNKVKSKDLNVFLSPSSQKESFWDMLMGNKYKDALSFSIQYVDDISEASILVLREKNSQVFTQAWELEMKKLTKCRGIILIESQSPFACSQEVLLPLDQTSFIIEKRGYISTPEQALEVLLTMSQKIGESFNE